MAAVQLKQMDYDRDNARWLRIWMSTLARSLISKPSGAKVSSKVMKQNVPVTRSHTVDRDLLVEGQRKFARRVSSQGYFEARWSSRKRSYQR